MKLYIHFLYQYFAIKNEILILYVRILLVKEYYNKSKSKIKVNAKKCQKSKQNKNYHCS